VIAKASAKREMGVALPPRSDRLFRLFRWYARRYCAKHLHAVRLARWGSPPVFTGPAVIVVNHPSWWDPLVEYVLTGLFHDRVDWGVIEAAALKQYRFLGRAGLFGVQSGSVSGASQFLLSAATILGDPRATIWINAHGRFTDVRERPVTLRSGVGHLAHRIENLTIVPLALEMVFWDQRTPEALAAFGSPIESAGQRFRSPADWTRSIAEALEIVQGRVAADSMSRDASRFETLVAGRAGIGGVYDWWRRMTSWIRGERFTAEHRND
jgi:1-acyl-sn-glycerol-3-phosphate acyltransferase